MIYGVKLKFESFILMRLIVAVFVLGENMVVHGKDVLIAVGGILKRAFCLECGLC